MSSKTYTLDEIREAWAANGRDSFPGLKECLRAVAAARRSQPAPEAVPVCPKCRAPFEQPVWKTAGRVKCGECGEWFPVNRPAHRAKAKGGERFSLQVIVNGQPTAVTARLGEPLRTAIQPALTASGSVGRPPEDWEFRNRDGVLISHDEPIRALPEGELLFLNLRAGYFAAEQPAAPLVSRLGERICACGEAEQEHQGATLDCPGDQGSFSQATYARPADHVLRIPGHSSGWGITCERPGCSFRTPEYTKKWPAREAYAEHVKTAHREQPAAPPGFRVHRLKTWPGFFDDVVSGRKTFEIRANDRGFKVGDEWIAEEWDPATKAYTGRRCSPLTITYVTPPCPELLGDLCGFSFEKSRNVTKPIDPPAPVTDQSGGVTEKVSAPAVPQPGVQMCPGDGSCGATECGLAGGGACPYKAARASVTPAAVQGGTGECPYGCEQCLDHCDSCDTPMNGEHAAPGDICWDCRRELERERAELRAQAVRWEQQIQDSAKAHERMLSEARADNDRLRGEVVRLGNERDARDIRIDELVRFLEVRAKVLVAMEKQLDNRDARIAGLEASSADLVRRAQEAETRLAEAFRVAEHREAVADKELAELRGKLAAAELARDMAELGVAGKIARAEKDMADVFLQRIAEERAEATARERSRCRYWLTRWMGGSVYQSIDRVLDGATAPEVG